MTDSIEQGWVSLYRKLLRNPMSNRPNYLSVWVHLLLKANYREKKMIWNNQVIVIHAGQLITGRKELSKETGVPETTIERILGLFEKEGQIGQQKTTKYRLITILNWKEYQDTDNKRTTNGQQTDTNNKDNNINKDNKNNTMSSTEDSPPLENSFDIFWSNYPRKEKKKTASEIWKRRKLGIHLEVILNFIKEALKTDKWKKGFIPHPTTFLNGEIWNDDLTAYNDKKNATNQPSNKLEAPAGKYDHLS